jgi:ABC-type branched-subunit amino acid transport system substrate-binding protein
MNEELRHSESHPAPKPTPVKGKRWLSILKFVGLGLAGGIGIALSIFLFLFSQDYFLQQREIWFIFDNGASGGVGHPGQDLEDGILAAIQEYAQFFREKRILLKVFSDNGDPKTAQKLAKEAVENDKVIAVVGHLSSSIMSDVSGLYLDSKLPVIMPVPTNPKFTKDALSANKNFIRMPPTDDIQAQVARDFMFDHHAQRIAVIEDADNSTYSEYLGRKFISEMRRASVQPGGPRIVYVSTVGGSMGKEFIPPVLTDLNVDTVFFAGSTDNALTFVEALLAVRPPGKMPTILMSDGIVDSKFLARLSDVPPELYVTFPLSDETRNGRCAGHFVLSYCPYGYDSVEILKQIVAETAPNVADNLWSKHYYNYTRSDFLNFFNDKLKSERPFELRGYFNKSYRFDKLGDNSSFRFSVWHADPKREFVKG